MRTLFFYFLLSLHSAIFIPLCHSEEKNIIQVKGLKGCRRVYLAIYPRSGTHWVRYLIEAATHTATFGRFQYINQTTPKGRCYHLGYNKNCHLPIKGQIALLSTHFPTYGPTSCKIEFDCQPYVKALRIIRNPVDSFYSYYCFCNKDCSNSIPRGFLQKCIRDWIRFQEYWDNQPNVITFRYEDLYRKPDVVLSEILTLLEYPFEKTDIERAITLYAAEGGAELKHIHHFSRSDLELIRKELGSYLEKYHYEIPV